MQRFITSVWTSQTPVARKKNEDAENTLWDGNCPRSRISNVEPEANCHNSMFIPFIILPHNSGLSLANPTNGPAPIP